MQNKLIKGLLNYEFHERYGDQLPKDFWSKDLLRIRETIAFAHKEFQRDLNLDEVHQLVLSRNPTLTDTHKMNLTEAIAAVNSEPLIGLDVGATLVNAAWYQDTGRQLAEHGLSMMNGVDPDDRAHLLRVQELLDKTSITFNPRKDYEYEASDLQTVLDNMDAQQRWKFNLSPVASRLPGISPTHFVVGGARPEVGKTSFIASLISAPGGFAWQGARCHVLCNEEHPRRVVRRHITACVGLAENALKQHQDFALEIWENIRDNVKVIRVSEWTTDDLDIYMRDTAPDIVVVDMLDKIRIKGSYAREDQELRSLYHKARDLAGKHETTLFGFSQLSAEAEGRVNLNMSMLENSRTGKAAEADLAILIGKQNVEGVEDTDLRHICIAKNKLGGGHFRSIVKLDGETGRYSE